MLGNFTNVDAYLQGFIGFLIGLGCGHSYVLIHEKGYGNHVHKNPHISSTACHKSKR